LIRYELAEGDYNELDDFIYSLFPKAQILHTRSDSQIDYLDSIKLLDNVTDDWVFYSPNNDHPLLISQPSDIAFINSLIKKGDEYSEKNNFVSIAYSHWTEYINGVNKRFGYFPKGTQKIEDTRDCLVFDVPKGDYSSIQIVNKKLFKDWFTFMDLSGRLIMRAEDLAALRDKKQIEIVPKKELCSHFDGYEHMLGYSKEIFTDLIPPLFIPFGFFEKKIKIAYGYDTYRPGWTNINPLAKNYSFRDLVHGTDLKINIEDIPLFWKSRILTIDVNPKFNHEKAKQSKDLHKAVEGNYSCEGSPKAIGIGDVTPEWGSNHG
jgi:hypothetical protein